MFKNTALSPNLYISVFILKLLAVPTFCFVYIKFYGNYIDFDAGVYYTDSKAICEFGKTYPFEYIKVLFGLQDDSVGSHFYKKCIVNTYNWDNGRVEDFFYNDNRILIRLHSLIHFIAFNNYFVHAVFSCFYGFLGLTLFYKSVVEYFRKKEKLLFLFIMLPPSLWFYSGAVLKEPLLLLTLGFSVYYSKKFICSFFNDSSKKSKLIYGSFFCLGLLFCTTLKPYIQTTCVGLFTCFFILQHVTLKRKVLLFLGLILSFGITANFACLAIKGKSISIALLGQQSNFKGMAKGGIFLVDNSKFVRVDFDYKLVKKVDGKQNYYTIKEHVPYIYWEHTHQQDTLFCNANKDTLHQYKLEYDLPEAGSNFEIEPRINFKAIVYAFYNTMCYPLFYNIKGVLKLTDSLENLLILISLLVLVVSLIINLSNSVNTNYLFIICILICVLLVFLIIGLTSPNYGAIQRYRAPVLSFFFLSALHAFPLNIFTRK